LRARKREAGRLRWLPHRRGGGARVTRQDVYALRPKARQNLAVHFDAEPRLHRDLHPALLMRRRRGDEFAPERVRRLVVLENRLGREQ